MVVAAGVAVMDGVSVNTGVDVSVGSGDGVGEYAATVWVSIITASSTALVPTTSTAGGVACGAQAVSKIIRIKILKRSFMKYLIRIGQKELFLFVTRASISFAS